MIKAYIFDLDDTLYPEYDYVKSGFKVVADVLEDKYSIKGAYDKLIKLFDSDIGNVYNRLFDSEKIRYTSQDIRELVDLYRKHKPVGLFFFDGVVNTLQDLRAEGMKLGIVTDGRVECQQAKISALGVCDLVDEIVVTDSLGGECFRKPNPTAFEIILSRLNVKAEEAVYIGDNPKKDFAIKKYMPIKTVMKKNRQGIYNGEDFLYGIRPDATINSISELRNGSLRI